MKAIKQAVRTVDNSLDFFKEWLRVIRGYSNLTLQEEEFMAIVLNKRHELSKVILDKELLTRNLFDITIKKQIVEALELPNIQRFENLMNQLRRKKVVLENNEINPTYIPQIKDTKEFIIAFTIKNNGEG
jgi:hypothetical protein